MDVKKRIFSNNPSSKKNRTLRLADEMWEALNDVARDKGYKRSDLIEELLERYLQERMADGIIRPPKGN